MSCCQSCVLATNVHKYVQLLESLRIIVDFTLYHVLFNSSPNRKFKTINMCVHIVWTIIIFKPIFIQKCLQWISNRIYILEIHFLVLHPSDRAASVLEDFFLVYNNVVGHTLAFTGLVFLHFLLGFGSKQHYVISIDKISLQIVNHILRPIKYRDFARISKS